MRLDFHPAYFCWFAYNRRRLDRDCSVQRRHQKVVETAPADTIPQATRDLMFADAVRLTSGANYRNAGTVEPVATAAERLIYQ